MGHQASNRTEWQYNTLQRGHWDMNSKKPGGNMALQFADKRNHEIMSKLDKVGSFSRKEPAAQAVMYV